MRFRLFTFRYQKDSGGIVVRSERLDTDSGGVALLEPSQRMRDQQILTPYKLINNRLMGRRAIVRFSTNTRASRLLVNRDPALLLDELREYESRPESVCIAYAGEDL